MNIELCTTAERSSDSPMWTLREPVHLSKLQSDALDMARGLELVGHGLAPFAPGKTPLLVAAKHLRHYVAETI